MAEQRERFPRATGTEAEPEAGNAEEVKASAEEPDKENPTGDAEGEEGGDGDGDDVPGSYADWLADSEADLGFWIDEEFAADGDEDGEWTCEDGDEAVSLLGGSGISAERRMSEASSLIALSEFGLAEGSVHISGKVEDEEDVTALLARVVPTSPLLGLLDSEWLRALPEMGKVTRVRAGETLVEEGDDGDTLFLILTGGITAEVFDRETGEMLQITTLRPGDFYGEAALLSDAVRSATLRAVSDAIVLELESEAVLTLVENQPSVIKLLMRFFRARMVGTVVVTASLFQHCTVSERRNLITRFRLREVAPDTNVVRPGDTVDGLYLVVDGELSVLNADNVVVGRLRRGDVYGERALLDGFPSTSGLRSESRAWLLRMPRTEFLEAACHHPHLLECITRMASRPAQL